jgi:hypothetical protein
MEDIFFRNWGMARTSALLQLQENNDDPHAASPASSSATPMSSTISPPPPSVWCQALAPLGRYSSGATPVFQVLQAMLPTCLNEEPDAVADCQAQVNSSSSNGMNIAAVAKDNKAAISLTAVPDGPVVSSSSKSNDSCPVVPNSSSYTATSLLLWCICLLRRILHRFWYFAFTSPVHALNNKDAFFGWWEIHAAQAIATIHAKKKKKSNSNSSNKKNRPDVKHDGAVTYHEKVE